MTKNFLKSIAGAFVLWLFLMNLNCLLLAQTNFSLGIYNYDVPGPRAFNSNEQQLINNLNANFITGMEKVSQDSIISVYSRQLNPKKTGLEHDPAYQPGQGPYYPIPGDPHSTVLWAYISRNIDSSNISISAIERFIHNTDSLCDNAYLGGLGEIRVAHQGWMDSTSHWSRIKYACDRIQFYFGDRVNSSVCHNIFHWIHHSSLQDFFSYMTTLDVYRHEEYPFHVHNAGADPLHPTACAPFCGWNYQDWYIDSLILGSYDQTRNALIAGQGQNHHTRLEVIIQTQREYYPATQTFVRRPTESEIWLQAFLALSRCYKGVHSYVYRTNNTGNSWGLIDERTPRQQNVDSLCYYQTNPNNYNRNSYGVVTQLYDHLSALGDDILPLTVLDAFTWTGTARSYITDIIDDVYDGGHGTIEISLMDHPSNNYDYFLLVNRRCSSDDNGTPAAPQTIAVHTNKSGSLSSVIFS
jgi:hypothetical protein